MQGSWLRHFNANVEGPCFTSKFEALLTHDVERSFHYCSHNTIPDGAHWNVGKWSGKRYPKVLLWAFLVRDFGKAAQRPERDAVALPRVLDGSQAMTHLMDKDCHEQDENVDDEAKANVRASVGKA